MKRGIGMSKKMKQLVAHVVVVVMMSLLLGGCSNGKETKVENQPSSSTADSSSKVESDSSETKREPITYTLMFAEHPSQPFKPDTWLFLDVIKEKFNVNFDIQPIPSSSYIDKVNMAIASNSITDIVNSVDLNTLNDMGGKGMFLNLWDYIDQMPNAKKAFDTIDYMAPCKLSDDQWYAIPSKVPHANMMKMSIDFITMARGDIMKDNGLSAPKTFDDLYGLLKSFKDLSPKSSPWVTRLGVNNMLYCLAPGVGITFDTDYTVYDFNAKSFSSALTDEGFRYLVEFMNKCYKDGLLDQEYAISDTKQWEDKIVSGKGFFAIDYFARPEMMTNAARTAGNNEYVLEAMLPPAKEGGEQKVYAKNEAVSYQGINAKVKSPERLMEVYDWWFFSEEGSLLGFFGKEDVSYTRKDKVISYKYSEDASNINDIASKYSTDYYGFMGLAPGFFDYTINYKNDESMSDALKNTFAVYDGQTVENRPVVIYSGDALEARKNFITNLQPYLDNEINKFIMGVRPLSEWDAFIKECNEKEFNNYIETKNSVHK